MNQECPMCPHSPSNLNLKNIYLHRLIIKILEIKDYGLCGHHGLSALNSCFRNI